MYLKLIIRTYGISVKLEVGTSDHMPLIVLNVSLDGELNNWTSRVRNFHHKADLKIFKGFYLFFYE